MSFASETKKTICTVNEKRWCCKTSELSGLLCFGASYKNKTLTIKSESAEVFDRTVLLIDRQTSVSKQKITLPKSEGGRYILKISGTDEIMRLCEEMGFEFDLKNDCIDFCPSSDTLQNSCCKAAFVRGAYLMGGTVTDPEKNYHLEFVCKYAKAADKLSEILESMKINARLTVRKNSFVIYIKEFETIANLLGHLGAGSEMMELYNLKIERELRNDVNRAVNCDNANIKRITAAAEVQINAIKKIAETCGLESLPQTLFEVANARLENPEASLEEIGKTLDVPIGKSGVNHRLSRIVEFAKNL